MFTNNTCSLIGGFPDASLLVNSEEVPGTTTIAPTGAQYSHLDCTCTLQVIAQIFLTYTSQFSSL